MSQKTTAVSVLKKGVLLSALFLVPFTFRCVYLLFILRDTLLYLPDERLYLGVGLRYVKGIMSGDISAFLENAEHPPLAKILIGLLGTALSNTGLEEWQLLRLYSSIISGATCVVVYFFGESLRRGLGWKAWLFFTIEPSSVFYGMVSLDVTYSLFASTSMLFLYQSFEKGGARSLLLPGAIFGLSLSSKYSAFAFTVVPVLWAIYRGYSPKRILQAFGLFVMPALVVLFALNPLLWSGSYLASMLNLQRSMGHTNFFGWFNPTMRAIGVGATAPGIVAHFLMDLYGIIMFPVGDMITSPYLIVVAFALIVVAIRRRPIEDRFFQILLIFFCPFFFMLSIPKQISYYAIVYAPYLSLLLALLPENYRKSTPEATESLSNLRWRLLFSPIFVFLALSSAAPVLAVQGIIAKGWEYPHTTTASSWILQIFNMDIPELFPTLMIILFSSVLVSIALSTRLPMHTQSKRRG